MRALVLVGCVVGCNGYQPPVYGVCSSDSECGGEVCSRSGECLAPSALAPPMMFSWTIDGAVPNTALCAHHPIMDLVLISDDGADPSLTLEVPCVYGAGLVLDRIPLQLLWAADLGPANVPSPEGEPNDVGWDAELLFDRTDPVMFYLTEPSP